MAKRNKKGDKEKRLDEVLSSEDETSSSSDESDDEVLLKDDEKDEKVKKQVDDKNNDDKKVVEELTDSHDNRGKKKKSRGKKKNKNSVDKKKGKEEEKEDDKEKSKEINVDEKINKDVKSLDIAEAKIIELLTGVKILESVKKSSEVVVEENLTRNDDPSLLIKVVDSIPCCFEILVKEFGKERFIEKELKEVKEITFKDFPIDLVMSLLELMRNNLEIINDRNKYSMGGISSLMAKAVGISDEMLRVIMYDNTLSDAIRMSTQIRDTCIGNRVITEFTNGVVASIYTELRKLILNNLDVQEMKTALMYVEGSSVGVFEVLEYNAVYPLPFENPFGLRSLLDSFGWLNILRIEGIESDVIPILRYSIVPSQDIVSLGRANITMAGPLKGLIAIGLNENIKLDVTYYFESLFLLGYVRLRVKFSDITDVDAQLIVALLCKLTFSFSVVEQSESMIDESSRIEADHIITAGLVRTKRFRYRVGPMDERFPLDSLECTPVGMRDSGPAILACLRTDHNGRGWLNNGILMRGVANVQEARYGCETMPFFVNRDNVQYDNKEETYFSRVVNQQDSVFFGVLNAIELVVKMGNPIIQQLSANLVKFFCRVNDYNLKNYASGFRMSQQSLRAMNADMAPTRREIRLIEVNAKSIFYFMRCKKDDLLKRRDIYIHQLQRESCANSDVRQYLHINLGARRIRDFIDPDQLIWPNGAINALTGTRSGKVGKYIQNLKGSSMQLSIPAIQLTQNGILGPMINAVVNTTMFNPGSVYVNMRYTIRETTPIVSIADMQRKYLNNPIIYMNLDSTVYNERDIMSVAALLKYINEQRAKYEIAIRAKRGVLILLPVKIAIVENGKLTCQTPSLKIKESDVGSETRLSHLLEMNTVKLEIVVFKPEFVNRPDSLLGDVYPSVSENVTSTPNIFQVNRLLSGNMRSESLYLIGTESLKSLFS